MSFTSSSCLILCPWIGCSMLFFSANTLAKCSHSLIMTVFAISTDFFHPPQHNIVIFPHNIIKKNGRYRSQACWTDVSKVSPDSKRVEPFLWKKRKKERNDHNINKLTKDQVFVELFWMDTANHPNHHIARMQYLVVMQYQIKESPVLICLNNSGWSITKTEQQIVLSVTSQSS